MNIFLMLLIAPSLALLVFVAHKVLRVHHKLYEIQAQMESRLDNHFSQVEALLALNHELALPKALRATRGWAGSPDFLLHVFRTAIQKKPRVVVECSSGVSTVVLARAMQVNGIGHVWSLEHEPEFAQRTREELARHDLQAWATVIDAPLQRHELKEGAWSWYEVSRLPAEQIDLLVVDGPPKATQRLARFPALPVLGEQLADSAVVLVDDAARPDETEMVKLWMEGYGVKTWTALFAEKGLAALERRSRHV